MQNLPLKFAIDTNILICLAVMKYRGEEYLGAANLSFRHHVAQQIRYLQTLLDDGKVELILTTSTSREIKNLPNISQYFQKDYSKPELAQLSAHNRTLKVLANKYIRTTPSIKQTYVHPNIKDAFDEKVLTLAKAYGHPPIPARETTLPFFKPTAPFALEHGYPRTDAFIVAEAAICGLNLISMDGDITRTQPINIPYMIRQINQNIYAAPSRPFKLNYITKNLQILFEEMPFLTFPIPQTQYTPLVAGIEYLSHEKFDSSMMKGLRKQKAATNKYVMADALQDSETPHAPHIAFQHKKALHGKLFQTNHKIARNPKVLDDLRDQLEHL